MANMILFHSVLGLRRIERDLAERVRASGHAVTLPDLYQGAATDDLDEGFAIKARIGWDAICLKAREALASTPGDAVLAGISMGAGVVAEFWASRPLAAGVLLLHGLATVPANTRPGLPVQLHVADTDPLFPEPDVRAWQESAEAARADVQVFRYPNSGHYFSDPALPDYNGTAAAQLWSRTLTFLT
ncbi:MAG: dienelactone hydrolase family protein [Mesorhizobium sp.]|uniref:dienelactone hydrolase family protein n=1 Tax=unclassified Mesorhizobium TaxID=325217 RepID=UPI000FC9DC2F|nr:MULTISPECIES: dienelactone hydrolase family protein [unclassified Mesorhizobium]RUW49559.1 dienelactone hydrolase family protein [Mesorhizobium sp. M8A.F.Ca.ET.021.01.1.1]RWC86288.1 MAG: dienelactone hydrolase family protein [Mesorhizobium sp.]RWF43312.1 MAG: dienelactone hydrolase family protein [Mesorhizobium sp.]